MRKRFIAAGAATIALGLLAANNFKVDTSAGEVG